MTPLQRAILFGFLAFFSVLNAAFAAHPELPTYTLLYGAILAYGLGFVGAFGITEAVTVGRIQGLTAPRKK